MSRINGLGDPSISRRWARTRSPAAPPPRRAEPLPSIVGRYGLAAAVVVVTVGLKLVVGDLGNEHPFVLLPAAVIVSTWYGGRGPGLFATALVAFASGALFLEPVGPGFAVSDVPGLVALVAEGVLVVVVTVGLHNARTRAEAEALAARTAQRELALALAIREEMLSLWTQKLRGPLADLEAHGRAALADLEREGYTGSATAPLQTLIDEAAHVGRVTARWDDRRQADLATPTTTEKT